MACSIFVTKGSENALFLWAQLTSSVSILESPGFKLKKKGIQEPLKIESGTKRPHLIPSIFQSGSRYSCDYNLQTKFSQWFRVI